MALGPAEPIRASTIELRFENEEAAAVLQDVPRIESYVVSSEPSAQQKTKGVHCSKDAECYMDQCECNSGRCSQQKSLL